MNRKQYNTWYHRQKRAELKRAKREARLDMLGALMFGLVVGGVFALGIMSQ